MDLIFKSILIVGGTCLVLSLVLFLSVPVYLKHEVGKKLIIQPDSDTYDQWVEPEVQILTKFYIFNLNNPREFIAGEKPNVTQKGPYVFTQKRRKFNITFSEGGETVSYLENRTYFFDQELSGNNSLDDVITFINVPAMGLGNKFTSLSDDKRFVLRQLIDPILAETQTALVETHRASEIIFDGYIIPFAVKMNEKFKGVFPPLKETFGLMYGKNGTNDGLYTVKTGKGDVDQLLEITEFNGKETLNVWKPDTHCDRVAGTDGSGFGPSVKSNSVKVFTTNLCRPFTLTFEGDGTVKDIDTRKYMATRKLFENPLINPENSCYCMKENLTSCHISGIMDLETCTNVFGLWASSPHFYQADEVLIDSVVGMQPDGKEHSTFLNVEPITGKTFAAAKRVQLNMQTPVTQDLKLFSKLTEVIYPFAWFEESFEITDKLAGRFKDRVATKMRAANLFLWLFFAASCLLMLIGTLPHIRKCVERRLA